jgi:hypothetical protein
MRKGEAFFDDGSVNDVLKEAAKYSENDVRDKLLYKGISIDLPPIRTVSLETVAPSITAFVRKNSKDICKQGFEGWDVFRRTSVWIRDNRENSRVKKCFEELIGNFHWFYDDEEIAKNMEKSEQYDEMLTKYNISNISELESILAAHSTTGASESGSINISLELLAQWGITSEDELNRVLEMNFFGAAVHHSTNNAELFSHGNDILNRARNNIINYLDAHEDYEFDKDNPQMLGRTIFRVRKFGHEIYIIARPSDYEQVILYYDAEIALLEHDKDCELWVENGVDPDPKKITLGMILRETGVNKISLKERKSQ